MKFKITRFKLTQQVITVVMAAVFLPLLIAGILLVNINQHAVRKELYYSTKVTLDNVNYRLSSSVEIPTYNLKFLANLIINSNLKLSKNEIESFMQYMVFSVPQIKSIEIFSDRNKLAISYNPENLLTYNFLDFTSDSFVYVHKNQGKQIITLFCKVPPNRMGYKIIKANLDNNLMQNVIFSGASNIDRIVRIINSQGYVVFAYPTVVKETDMNSIYEVPEEILSSSKVGMPVRFGPFKNQPSLYYRVPNSNLSIIIYTPESVTYYGIVLARSRILITLIFAAIISMIIGMMYANVINRNLRQLLKAVNAIAHGKYTRKVRLIKGVFTPYEIVFLANEFNAMASKISTTLKALKEANDQLAQLDKLKSNLIDTVSHEFRTPLTSIKGYTSRLMRQDIELPEAIKKKSLKVIKEQSERLSRMVEDLLVIPDLESNILRVYPDNTDLKDVLDRSISSFKDKHNSREITLYYPEELQTIFVDPDRLEQVIINLISNAIKYSNANSGIIVNVENLIQENSVLIEVINECEPIETDQLNSLFEKFKRLDDNLTRTTRGSGLGLFISKGIVEAMEGEITLEYTDKFVAKVKLPIDNNAQNKENNISSSD